MPPATAASPGKSIRRGAVSSRDSATAPATSANASAAKGRLKKNTQRQPRCWLMAPPTNGPIAVPIAARP